MKIKSIRQQATRLLAVSTLSLSFSSQAALVGRDLDGNLATFEAVYDDVLNITWLADANLAASNTFGVSGINTNGLMDWYEAESFIVAMNADDSGAGYLGVNTWRQSTVSPVSGGSVFNMTFTYDGSSDRGYQLSAPVDATYNQSGQSAGFTGSELGYHYYNNFDGIGACSGVGNNNTYGCVSTSIFGVDDATNTANLALFSNIVNAYYWTGTDIAPGSSSAFGYGVINGSQSPNEKSLDLYVWAVTSGDVAASAVPVPAAAWLFGSALLGLIGLKRKK